jgi:hypothetical protein
MTNFKQETLNAIKGSGHSEEDVMFVGSRDGKYRITLEKFKEISDFEYDSGFGSAAIATDLVVYFKDKTYTVRGEYDGSEWWEYNPPMTYSENDEYKSFKKLGGDEVMWDTLEEINEESND